MQKDTKTQSYFIKSKANPVQVLVQIDGCTDLASITFVPKSFIAYSPLNKLNLTPKAIILKFNGIEKLMNQSNSSTSCFWDVPITVINTFPTVNDPNTSVVFSKQYDNSEFTLSAMTLALEISFTDEGGEDPIVFGWNYTFTFDLIPIPLCHKKIYM